MNKTKTIAPLLALLLAVGLFAPACQTTYAPGSEPFVVEAERSLKVSFEVVDAFLLWEHENRTSVPQAVTATADKLRITYPQALASATRILRTYKANRTPEGKAELTTYLLTINAAMQEALQWLPEKPAQAAYAKALAELEKP